MVDEGLKIELGKQGVFVTTIEELYNWDAATPSGLCNSASPAAPSK